MSMTKFTPGPWHIEEDDWFADMPFIKITVGNDESRRGICEVLGSGPPETDDDLTERDRANARLISAAPDLYEALCGLVDAVSSGGPTAQDLTQALIRADAALIKVRGEDRDAL